MSDERSVENAVIFPGQGVQEAGMLDPFRDSNEFAERCGIAEAALRCDPLSTDPNRNEVGSIQTILASSFAWENYRQTNGLPGAIAGYSVGTWTALWAAGMIDFPTLIELAVKRACLMNAAAVDRPGAMLAVVGLGDEAIRDIVHRGHNADGEIHIANFNAPGNVTLAGESAALNRAEEMALEAGARQVKHLLVAGAWHSPMMSTAAKDFEAVLNTVSFATPDVPVFDNVTGDILPTEGHALRRQLAVHLAMPVQWERTVRSLIDMGCEQFVEIGHGNMLSRFGFFIDRSKSHRAHEPRSCVV